MRVLVNVGSKIKHGQLVETGMQITVFSVKSPLKISPTSSVGIKKSALVISVNLV